MKWTNDLLFRKWKDRSDATIFRGFDNFKMRALI